MNKNNITFQTREEVTDYLIKSGIDKEHSFMISEMVRKGMFCFMHPFYKDKIEKTIKEYNLPEELVAVFSNITYLPKRSD